MALLAEELVEEWLRRQGFFTIRGIHLGVHEIDLLALRPMPGGGLEARHVEVQAGVNPVSYLTPLTKGLQKDKGKKSGSQIERTEGELAACVADWIEKKFHLDRKAKLRAILAPGALWSQELVVHMTKHPEEVAEIEKHVTVRRLSQVMKELRDSEGPILGAAGTDFVQLAGLGASAEVSA